MPSILPCVKPSARKQSVTHCAGLLSAYRHEPSPASCDVMLQKGAAGLQSSFEITAHESAPGPHESHEALAGVGT